MLTITLPHTTKQWEFKEFSFDLTYEDHELYNELCVEEVVCVEATGDELLYIAQHFKNLPIGPAYGKVASQTWYGDHARFIVHNI
jgi:hypothetical protein